MLDPCAKASLFGFYTLQKCKIFLSTLINYRFAAVRNRGIPEDQLAAWAARHIRHNSFSNPSVALPTSQLILQSFRCFTYVTVHSRTLLSLLLPHRIFTYVTWRAAHTKLSQFRILTRFAASEKKTYFGTSYWNSLRDQSSWIRHCDPLVAQGQLAPLDLF